LGGVWIFPDSDEGPKFGGIECMLCFKGIGLINGDLFGNL
jgi:hypothetical protein